MPPALRALAAFPYRGFCSIGVGAEVFYKSPKLGKQLEYAESKGMSYALFVNGDALEVKNLKSKEQQKIADLAEWAKNIYSKSI